MTSVADMLGAARAGDRRAVARLISLVEEDSPDLGSITNALSAHAGGAYVVGLTGAPGVGKSTITSALVAEYRRRGFRVGVLAVDPSSPFSGGALLGDRVRMAEHSGDDGVYVRSLAARGHLGGLARSVPHALRVLDAVGYGVLLVETVGVGQSEVDIAAAADTTVVLLAPGMGDGIQAAKAGVLEIADILVVNKADRDGAEATAQQVAAVLARTTAGRGWEAPVLRTVATTGVGIAALVDAIAAHRRTLDSTGALDLRRRRRAIAEIEAIAVGMLRRRMLTAVGDRVLDALAAAVVAGHLDPVTAARRLIADNG
ncbi:MAG TPA: methylmalonyl Co-A mutase-associated GTPase MeaB [Sporichthyaceae bacterium]|jgi:LAO/AO transport system kinase|nr:methylmalonyl Co-A mutase-associated GTPase MeaB [Sporichthyaceae bacterium]